MTDLLLIIYISHKIRQNELTNYVIKSVKILLIK